MKQMYQIDIRTLPDPLQDPLSLEGLPQGRREKCLRYKIEADRKRCLGAGKIIQQILEEAGCTAGVRFGVNGKPEADGVYFNVSHSGDYVIGVAGDAPIGCDIEKMREVPPRVAERSFSDAEQHYIASQRDERVAFWKLWTLKESYMKMTGEGMRLPIHSFEMRCDDEIAVYRGNKEQPCEFQHFVLDGYSLAICQIKI